MLIESDLEDAGVKASCNWARETLVVEFDESKINEEKIKEMVKTSGYSLDAPPEWNTP